MSTVKIAAATSDGKHIDLHFGQAEILTVYTLSDTGEILATEQRPGLGVCVCRDDSGHGEEAIQMALKNLCDCKYLLVKRIGQHMVRELAANGIVSFELFGDIHQALEKIIQYEHKQQERIAARQSAAQ
jgi:predicted Fe-Mo cluster-binding NifX family protein